jgi:hypothetical protein
MSMVPFRAPMPPPQNWRYFDSETRWRGKGARLTACTVSRWPAAWGALLGWWAGIAWWLT